MKKITRILLVALSTLLLTQATFAYKYTSGYIKKSGTYVGGHYKTDSNSYKGDNFSTKGNINSFTGKKGYKNAY